MAVKLNAQQILSIIEANYSESTFAYNGWIETDKVSIPDELGNKEHEEKESFWKSIEEEMKPLTYLQRKEHSKYIEYLNMSDRYEVRNRWVLDYLGLGEVNEVVQVGGESQGTTWYSVKYFKDHDVFIRIDGHYTSYNGADFYDGYGKEVSPQERKIVVWE